MFCNFVSWNLPKTFLIGMLGILTWGYGVEAVADVSGASGSGSSGSGVTDFINLSGPTNACELPAVAPGVYVYRCALSSEFDPPLVLAQVNSWMCQEDLNDWVQNQCVLEGFHDDVFLASSTPVTLHTVELEHTEWTGGALQPGGKVYSQPQSRWWTRWFDRDDPSGKGDYETLNSYRKAGFAICSEPTAISCRTPDGPVSTSPGLVCDYKKGAYCINSRYPGGTCPDISVRYLCPFGDIFSPPPNRAEFSTEAKLCPGENPLVDEPVPHYICPPWQQLVSTPKPGMCICRTVSMFNSTN